MRKMEQFKWKTTGATDYPPVEQYNYTLGEVIHTIKNEETLYDRACCGGTVDIIDGIVDIEMYVGKAGRTELQEKTFDKYYREDNTLAVIAKDQGISHQGVSDCLAQCRKKIRKVLRDDTNR